MPEQPITIKNVEEAPETTLIEGIALCLSGGGYRAMLFHTGALWRLNEMGVLPRLHLISSVSGGSITAGVLGVHWNSLVFDSQGRATNFLAQIVTPIRQLASTNIDVEAVLKAAILPGNASDRVAQEYREQLFGTATLQDLPADGPRFVFNATNSQTGALWRFSRQLMGDYRVGIIANPTVEIADAVACSSAFPPFLSPHLLNIEGMDWSNIDGADLHVEPYISQAMLSDGGVYDNLGIEPAWKRYETILVSDGGQKMSPDPSPHQDWVLHTKRVLDIEDNQVRSLRKRQLIDSYRKQERTGAYWGIRTNIADYQLLDALPCPYEKTQELASESTRLSSLASHQQERLINWGYAVCDAAVRKHYVVMAKPLEFPYSKVGI